MAHSIGGSCGGGGDGGNVRSKYSSICRITHSTQQQISRDFFSSNSPRWNVFAAQLMCNRKSQINLFDSVEMSSNLCVKCAMAVLKQARKKINGRNATATMKCRLLTYLAVSTLVFFFFSLMLILHNKSSLTHSLIATLILTNTKINFIHARAYIYMTRDEERAEKSTTQSYQMMYYVYMLRTHTQPHARTHQAKFSSPIFIHVLQQCSGLRAHAYIGTHIVWAHAARRIVLAILHFFHQLNSNILFYFTIV